MNCSTTWAALPTATVVSASPWKAITGTGRSSGRARGAELMADTADPTSVAQPCGSPECTPTAANTSGYAAPSTAAIAPPAENPATYTRSRSTSCSAATSATIPARIAASPVPRCWSAGSNQFQYRIAFAEVTCSG